MFKKMSLWYPSNNVTWEDGVRDPDELPRNVFPGLELPVAQIRHEISAGVAEEVEVGVLDVHHVRVGVGQESGVDQEELLALGHVQIRLLQERDGLTDLVVDITDEGGLKAGLTVFAPPRRVL